MSYIAHPSCQGPIFCHLTCTIQRTPYNVDVMFIKDGIPHDCIQFHLDYPFGLKLNSGIKKKYK